MSNRLTLEGDQTLPEDFRVVKVYGKYIPQTELNGELSGDLYIERIDGYSPQIAQLSGMEEAGHSQMFGTFFHDDAIPITLSGDELGMWGALLKGLRFKAPAFKMPVFKGFKVNTRGLSRGLGNATKSLGKVGKQIGKGAQNAVKSYGKAWKDVGKGLGKGLNSVGKIVGQVAEGGMGLLQSMGQGQGEQPPDEEPTEEQLDETQNEDPGFSEEPTSEEQIEETSDMEEVNGELGFFPQVMTAAGTAGQMFNAFNSMQQSNAQAKHARSMDKMNAFASLLRPQSKAVSKPKPAPKKAASPNTSFSNPKLAQTPEGTFKLSYANRNMDNTTDSGGGSDGKKDDNKNLMYIGAGIAAIAGLAFIMNKKGK